MAAYRLDRLEIFEEEARAVALQTPLGASVSMPTLLVL